MIAIGRIFGSSVIVTDVNAETALLNLVEKHLDRERVRRLH